MKFKNVIIINSIYGKLQLTRSRLLQFQKEIDERYVNKLKRFKLKSMYLSFKYRQ